MASASDIHERQGEVTLLEVDDDTANRLMLNNAVHACVVWQRRKRRADLARKNRDRLVKLVPAELRAEYDRRTKEALEAPNS